MNLQNKKRFRDPNELTNHQKLKKVVAWAAEHSCRFKATGKYLGNRPAYAFYELGNGKQLSRKTTIEESYKIIKEGVDIYEIKSKLCFTF